MSLLSRLFGGGSAPEVEPEVYKEFNLFPEPVKEPGGYRVAARIEKVIGGEPRAHRLIRADTCASEEDAREISLAKAKLLIDERGDALFD